MYIYIYVYIYIIICIHTYYLPWYLGVLPPESHFANGEFPSSVGLDTHVSSDTQTCPGVCQWNRESNGVNNILQLTNSMDGLGSFPSLSHNEFHARSVWDPFPDYQQLNKYFSNIEPFEDTQNMMCGFLSQQFWYTVRFRCVMTKQACTWAGNHFIQSGFLSSLIGLQHML